MGEHRPAVDVDMSAQPASTCPTCAAALQPDDRYCEQCGTRLQSAPDPPRSEWGCATCGAPPEEIDASRRCSRCGAAWRSPYDRSEIDLGIAAAVSDRGRLRNRNEDAFYVSRSGGGEAMVVCDGISSSLSPHIAARRAADAAGHVLAHALTGGHDGLEAAVTLGIRAAQQAVVEVRWTARSDVDAPSCTLVCAIRRGEELAVGWVGDSRAYWIAAEGSSQLTADHSWAREQVSAGRLTASQAQTDPRAHEVTRWLGRDAPQEEPSVITRRPSPAGQLVLCSDGLWNYIPGADEIATLLGALPAEAAPVACARALTDMALAAGGQDNITVAVVGHRSTQGGVE
jgi:PPM family protein phosphatase